MKQISFLVFFVAFLFVQLEAKEERKRLKEAKYSKSEISKIVFTADIADFEVKTSPDTFVYIYINGVAANIKKLQEMEPLMKVVIDKLGSQVRVESLVNDGKGKFVVEVIVPEGIELDFTSKNSDMFFNATKNKIHINHLSGDIKFENIKGEDIRLNSKNAGVWVKNSAGDFQIFTTKSVEMSLLSGKAEVSTTGNILFQTLGQQETNLNSSNGDIQVKIPKTSAWFVKLNGQKISYDLVNVALEGNISDVIITGTLNKGDVSLKATASKGKISISNQ